MPDLGPRPDTSHIDDESVEMTVLDIAYIVGNDTDEQEMARELRVYVDNYLRPNPDLWILVHDRLARDKIISKAQFRNLLSLVLEGTTEKQHLSDL
jgi:predicted protein tyrosine phosphatase